MKPLVKKFIESLSPTWRIRMKFVRNVGYFPSLRSPRTFNEKVQARKLGDYPELFVICADKFAVRQYVEDRIGSQYLIPIKYSGGAVNSSQLKSMGAGIVVKCNHDSGCVRIIRDVESTDYEEVCKAINGRLEQDFGRFTDERWYSEIKPCVIVESLLQTSSGGVPEDYKFHIFRNGSDVAVRLQVDYDRFDGHTRSFYDENGNVLSVSLKYPNKYRPLKLSCDDYHRMKSLALKLAGDLPYVRVDMYMVDGDVYFGEMTFAHESGYGRFNSKRYDLEWGRMWGES